MSRYRIVKKRGHYYPQRRGRFFWHKVPVYYAHGFWTSAAADRRHALASIETDRQFRDKSVEIEYLPDSAH